MHINVTSKSIQDRYVKLQTLYDRGDAAQQKMLGVCGEVGELEELLGEMQEARDDLETQQAAQRAAANEREEAKEHIGKELVVRALLLSIILRETSKVLENAFAMKTLLEWRLSERGWNLMCSVWRRK
jgi:hypothetical protein